jgi:hypothetical protein
VRTLAVWIHPLVGLATTVLAFHGASLALRARRLGARGAEARRRHRALMPWVLGLVVASWAGGLASAWLWRDPEDLAASGHHQVGTFVVVAFALAAIAGRRINRDPRLRRVHPWIGAVALLASGVQIFLGLQIVPVR